MLRFHLVPFKSTSQMVPSKQTHFRGTTYPCVNFQLGPSKADVGSLPVNSDTVEGSSSSTLSLIQMGWFQAKVRKTYDDTTYKQSLTQSNQSTNQTINQTNKQTSKQANRHAHTQTCDEPQKPNTKTMLRSEEGSHHDEVKLSFHFPRPFSQQQ